MSERTQARFWYSTIHSTWDIAKWHNKPLVCRSMINSNTSGIVITFELATSAASCSWATCSLAFVALISSLSLWTAFWVFLCSSWVAYSDEHCRTNCNNKLYTDRYTLYLLAICWTFTTLSLIAVTAGLCQCLSFKPATDRILQKV